VLWLLGGYLTGRESSLELRWKYIFFEAPRKVLHTLNNEMTIAHNGKPECESAASFFIVWLDYLRLYRIQPSYSILVSVCDRMNPREQV
jgi:hypothetical protein